MISLGSSGAAILFINPASQAGSYPSQFLPELGPAATPPAYSIQRLPPIATGYRHNTTGALTNVGTNAYYYSSSSFATGNINAGYLNFNSGNVNPLNNANRAAALSVRCVQHLRGGKLFLFFSRLCCAECSMRAENSLPTRNDAGYGLCQSGQQIPQSAAPA